jgi:FtsP/CotA-like multicopper oxidase with cupredoxin domain
LPVLNDVDDNPNDAAATYNLSADGNIAVKVATPAGSWTTPMMRFNGLQLPPVIKAKRGTAITVNVKNNLAEDTTIHWHGFKIPAIQDGGPESPIPAGGSHTYSFELVQAAASLWFHPHADGTTATQVYNGLAGGFVVTDDISEALEANKSLPSGTYDIPILVQDRTFGADNGSGIRPLVYGGMMTSMTGMLGDRILVNGVEQPSLKVETRQYRFRVYNGSNARSYDLALDNGATFKVIGTDGGLLPAPVTTDHIVLGAGERSEIVIDFRANGINDSIALVNRTTANREVMRFDVATSATDDVTLYTSLPPNADVYQRLTAADATNTRSFVMSMGGMMGPGGMSFLINGKRFDVNRVDEVVANGATEIWSISNTSGMAHPFHAHAIQWQILDRNNVPASGIDLGWKDTVLVQSGETVRFIGRFDPVINKGMYMYHCHILEHEEAGMMGTFMIQ